MKRSVRTFAVLLCSLLIAASITATALAAPPEPADVDIAYGSITIGDGTYTQGTGSAVTIPEDGLVITGESEENTITVNPGDGETAAFTISGLTLSTATGASLIYVQSGSAEITLAGVNALTGSGGTDAGALIRVSKGQTLTIKGEGSLELNNGTESTAAHGAAIGGSTGEDGGTINIESGNITIVQYGPGAGIGGGGPGSGYITGDSGDISISGGNIDITVTAVDSNGGGCGIGPGMNYKTTPYYKYDGVLNSITISGGKLNVSTVNKTAQGYEYHSGSAIGTGRMGAPDGQESRIHITGDADVTATVYGASSAIGGAEVPVKSSDPYGSLKIDIDGKAKVNARTIYIDNSLYCGAAIGLGANGFTMPVYITVGGEAEVFAEGSYVGAGIGSAFVSSSADTTISILIHENAKVTAIGGQQAAGIGTSMFSPYVPEKPDILSVTITDKASVIAYGGHCGAAIGSGDGFTNNDSGNITITGEAKVTAAGGAGASAIGAGASGQVAGTTTITAGTYVEAYADGTKFAIDIDLRNDAASINVSDTVLNGRFAEDANPPVDEDDKPSTIYLLKDGEIDSELTLPDDYRSFAVTASDGTGVIKVQNAADMSQYAYYLDTNNAKQIIYPLYENVDDDGNYEMLTKDDLNWVSFIDVKLMDITIYTGGAGYAGAVDAEGNEIGDESGFPEPGFIITAPEGVDVEELTLVYENGETRYEWTLAPYSPGEHNVYRFQPVEGTPLRNILMQFTNEIDGTVTVVDTDDFVVEDYLHQTLSMEVFSEGIGPGQVSFTDGENTYPITVGGANITVRSTTDNAVYAGAEIAQAAEGEPRMETPEDIVYYINHSEVQVANDSGIALLFDDIIETDENDTHKMLLRDRALTELGEGNWQFEYKYLDLVDTANGNAWVKASNNVTVYWPRPENAPKDAEFTLLHFEGLHEGLHREISIEEVEGMVGSCKVTKILLTPSEDGEYLCFEIEPGGFSPFVLAWETPEPDEPDGPDIPPYIPPVTPSEPDYKPEWLNTEDHYAYIIGYEDGTVRPNGSITRAEVATIFFRLLTDEAREEYWTETYSYTDVSRGDWYNTAVSTLSRLGILGGYEDGTFRPNSGITRAEFAKIAVSFFEYEGIEAENVFTDVAHGSWYEDFVAAAAEIGLIEGYEDGSFRPESGITRAEACTIINRTLGRAPDKGHLLPESEMLTWPDNPESAWYYAQIQEATNSHEYKWLGAIEQWTAKLPERDWTA